MGRIQDSKVPAGEELHMLDRLGIEWWIGMTRSHHFYHQYLHKTKIILSYNTNELLIMSMLPTIWVARSNDSFPSYSKNENVEIFPLNAVRRVLYFPT